MATITAIQTVKENKDGELYFEIPKELVELLGWYEGMSIEWSDNGDGSWALRISQRDKNDP
ncbi:hypothetical protein C942_02217 [Photobacterium marinum]|uniref:AbrB/MazE/SpoVT family DNA-binding domain-containing protein n=1 Tax=Photobacterium marinum TaxID=1056511 RepID=L8J782_9GAMM|nr:hypothetical protein [Photobacterium marinum]ELR64646.1 hypothetical protein C942_02217 [Photobacterium marinum]